MHSAKRLPGMGSQRSKIFCKMEKYIFRYKKASMAQKQESTTGMKEGLDTACPKIPDAIHKVDARGELLEDH